MKQTGISIWTAANGDAHWLQTCNVHLTKKVFKTKCEHVEFHHLNICSFVRNLNIEPETMFSKDLVLAPYIQNLAFKLPLIKC